jgi:hypothetical protein
MVTFTIIIPPMLAYIPYMDPMGKKINICVPIGSMYGIYANIGGIMMVSMLPYIAYMDPMGYDYNPFSLDRR